MDSRSVILAILILIIVLILVRSQDAVIKMTKVIPDKKISEITVAEVPVTSKSPPSLVPYYSKFERKGGLERVVADYTPVPHNQGRIMKPTENPKNFIIDRKFAEFGDRITPVETPQNITNINLKMAAAMAGKPESEITQIWEKITPVEVANMLQAAADTEQRIRQDLIDSGLSDEDIEKQYREQEQLIQSVSLNFNCENVRSDCDMWRESNDCIGAR